ncbi:MAG: Membrane-bound lytic murein transglycosylase precursor, partial [Pseudomonadota bacterium]
YLQKIHAMHGEDWFLALASYNWGENAVARAVRKNQARGLPTGYLSLDMPAETRHYVPKLIALKNIIARADELGFTLPPLPNRPYFVTIEKTRPIDLKLAAQFAGMSVEEFVALNPAHNRPVIAASRNNQIKLPADRRQSFLEAVARHEEARKVFASWQPYTLKPGESLDTVAGNAGVSVAEIRRANGLKEQQRLVAGTRILAPQHIVEDEMRVEEFVAPRIYEQVDKPAVYHTVGSKESIGSISERYGISAATLAAWNGVKQGVRRGMRLLVRPAATQTLLTTEEGDRSVVATAPKPGFVKVAATNDDDAQPDQAERSTHTRKAASRATGRRETAAKPASAVKVVSRPAASVGLKEAPGRARSKNAPETRASTSTSTTSKAIIRTSTQPSAQDGRKGSSGSRQRGT